jgi:hypothetical protein
MESLLAIAFSKENTNEAKKLRFEAQRKLILMLMMYDANKYINKKIKVGKKGIDTVSNAIYGQQSIAGKRNLILDGENYGVEVDGGVKTEEALLRKIIVRNVWDLNGDFYNDIFRESIIFTKKENSSWQEKDLEEVEFAIPEGCILRDDKGKVLQTIKAPACVGQYILQLFKNAKSLLKDNECIEISSWKNCLNGMQSNGAGGGGDIRMCKFYVNYYKKDKDGNILEDSKVAKEIQMFVPNKDKENQIVGGEYDYKNKKEDDESYAIRRLLESGDWKSFLALLYPRKFYPDINLAFDTSW